MNEATLNSAKLRKLCIVLPVYNEQTLLRNSVERVLGFASQKLTSYNWQVLIVNNGSTDRTDQLADHLAAESQQVQAIHMQSAGRGGALLRACEIVRADYILYTDVDLSADLVAIPDLLNKLNNGADLAIGSRLLPASTVERSLHRELLSRGYNLLLSSLFNTNGFSDAQCGLKAWRLKRLRPLIEKTKNRNWFFDTELLLLAVQEGYQIAEVPVIWTEGNDSKVNIPITIVEKILGVSRLWLRGVGRNGNNGLNGGNKHNAQNAGPHSSLALDDRISKSD